ncbi:MAG: 50S ribosomal protein L11 methyltransferase [Anaerolineae bacterium]
MYSLSQFGDMIRDSVRMNAFIAALQQVVQPDSVVIDLGAGTGVFSLIACELGARHVYAIEPNPLIAIGAQTAAANGYADRITFIQEISTRVTLPEKGDVLIADIRGKLPLFQRIIATFADARERLLKPGAAIIPQRDLLYASLAGAPEFYRDHILQPWQDNTFNIDMRAAMPLQINTAIPHRFKPEAMLVEPQHWATLDYTSQTNPNVGSVMQMNAVRAGTAHFVSLWFDAVLADGVGYSSAPGVESAPQVYGALLLPLAQPVAVEPGDSISLDLKATLIGTEYLLHWNTHIAPTSAERQPVDLKQSTFFSTPLGNLRKRTRTFTPTLTTEGEINRHILNAMTGAQNLDAIAGQLLAAFPGYIADFAEALARVSDVSQAYSR